ncbi:hypothetical protein CRG98_013485 [Punica granatum]|uniref:Uncharacterized protein n=1 Tax=Punica granatum TaxID=22663 RepID=A0A2I0KC71_PUNGR|nr:hypothetical protein CRG98_013485 [Punica granatum]
MRLLTTSSGTVAGRPPDSALSHLSSPLSPPEGGVCGGGNGEDCGGGATFDHLSLMWEEWSKRGPPTQSRTLSILLFEIERGEGGPF